MEQEPPNYMFALIRDDTQIDITNLDENDQSLAAALFYGEFRHERKEGDKIVLLDIN